MKRSTFIILLTLLIPLAGISQTKSTFIDDIYFKPGDEKSVQKTGVNKQAPNYKNGAKEIIYIERDNVNVKTVNDTLVLGHTSDKLNSAQYDNGNDNKAVEPDLEYALRIRQFHNTKDTVLIIDTIDNNISNCNNTYIVIENEPDYWNYNRFPYDNWGWGGYGYGGFYGYNGFGGYSPWGGYYNNYYGYGGYGCLLYTSDAADE